MKQFLFFETIFRWFDLSYTDWALLSVLGSECCNRHSTSLNLYSKCIGLSYLYSRKINIWLTCFGLRMLQPTFDLIKLVFKKNRYSSFNIYSWLYRIPCQNIKIAKWKDRKETNEQMSISWPWNTEPWLNKNTTNKSLDRGPFM